MDRDQSIQGKQLKASVNYFFLAFIRSVMGRVLWFDNRHPLGPIVQKYGSRICYDAAIPVYAKVNTIIEENRWKWPAVRSFNRACYTLESTQELLD